MLTSTSDLASASTRDFDSSREAVNVIQYFVTSFRNDSADNALLNDALHRLHHVYSPLLIQPLFTEGSILDIGAGIGLFSCLAASLYPSRTVYAFEPDSDLCEKFTRAIKELHLNNISLTKAAVATTDTATADLQIHDDGVFRKVSLQTPGRIKVVNCVNNKTLNGQRFSLAKIVAPGHFFALADKLRPAADALTGEVWRCDYINSTGASISRLSESQFVWPTLMMRDAETQLLYKSPASQRNTRTFAIGNGIASAASPLVSIVVPTYNIGRLVEEAVESIVSSQPKGTEVLVIDDGSTDPVTLSALKSLARLPTVQILHKRNGGCASARNYGLKRAKGRYIAFVDGDDFVSQDFLPLLLDTIHINASNISEVAFSTFFQRNKKVVANPEPYASARIESGFLDNLWLVLRRQPSIWRRLYRRQWLLDNSLSFPEHISAYDDLEFQFATLFLNKGTAFNTASCYFYRKDRDNQDVAAADARHFGTFNMLIRLESFLREKRVPQEHIILFDLFALDCLAWSYELLHESLQPIFVATVINYLFGQRSVNRVKNVYWEISKDLSKPLFFAICNQVSSEEAAVAHSKSAIHFADQVYDYRFPAELAKAGSTRKTD